MKTKLLKFLAMCFALVLTGGTALADLSGTNAVTVLEDNVNNATNKAWPLVIGIITALVALSVFLRVGKKGGVKT